MSRLRDFQQINDPMYTANSDLGARTLSTFYLEVPKEPNHVIQHCWHLSVHETVGECCLLNESNPL